jgi:glyoxylase-like metal-dependent hydrolase (beta-lactamase superfamily II)
VSRTRQVAPGVDRLGDTDVSFYLVDHPDGLVLVDAGLPGHLPQLREHLADSGHALSDIRAVLLTHAHPDHTGLAGPLQEAGAEIWIHEQDAPILSGGPRTAMRLAKPERSLLPYLLRRPAALVTHDGVTGHIGPTVVCRAFTHDGAGALASLDRLADLPATLVLPGHGDPFAGTPGAAAEEALRAGLR